jgi:hypothetical protein
VRRDVFDAVGGFDPDMAFSEDAELWMRIATRFPFSHDRRRLVKKVVMPGSVGQQVDRRTESQRRVTDKLVQIEPRLAALVPKRNALISYKRGVTEMRRGEFGAARQWLREAIAVKSPVRARAAIRLTMALRPTRSYGR